MRIQFACMTLLAACTATVATAPPPNRPAPPPAAPPPAGPPPSNDAPPPPPPVAASPQRHPHYLQALSDLRAARAYLERPAGLVVKWDENHAIREIDAAMNEIRQASIDDGKPLADHPPIDVAMVWGDRLHRSRELLAAANRDVTQVEDNTFAKGLKNRALSHIGKALHALDEGIADAAEMHAPPPPPVAEAHPAYLHALADLRMARALLARPAHPDVKWDEQTGIREIDAAINEIRQASIDDGKPLGDHPPIDAKWNHRDRLRQAMTLLDKSAKDITERESNDFAKGLRGRAVDHIHGAVHAIEEAIRDRKEDTHVRNEEKREEKREEKAEKHGR